MNDRPNDLEIEETTYFEKGANPELLLEVKKAWTQICRRTKESMGRKLALARPPYVEWVKDKVKSILFPFKMRAPLCEQPPIILSASVPTEEYDLVRVENKELRQKD